MSTNIQHLSDINRRATNALIREVGVVDTIRFLNQFRPGHGDYTMERKRLFKEMSVKDIVGEIENRRKCGT